MPCYEIIHEIFNQCARNQMRDVFVEERVVADPESYVRSCHPDKALELDKTVLPDGSQIFDLDVSGVRQRYSFTPV